MTFRFRAIGFAIWLGMVAPAFADDVWLGGSQVVDDAWLEVVSPAPDEPPQDVALFEVAGRAGARGREGFDLIVAIDLSDSTLDPSGIDLDEDGEFGVTDRGWLAALERRGNLPARLTARLARGLDLEDSILAAELEATGALIDRLDSRRFRVGLVVFSDEAHWAAPLGSTPVALRKALAAVRIAAPDYLRGTNLAAAVELATEALAPEDAPPSAREKIIVLLTDGRPTLPIRGGPAFHAMRAAREAGMRGIRVHPVAIGPRALEAEDVLLEMARWSEGRLHRIESPADVAAQLRRLDLVGLVSLEIRNVTSGESARAVRTFPDGSFDGFVQLAVGVNRLRVQAERKDGRKLVVERMVVLRSRGGSGDSALQERRLEALRRRTRELEMWAEIERRRREARVTLEIRVEKAPDLQGRY